MTQEWSPPGPGRAGWETYTLLWPPSLRTGNPHSMGQHPFSTQCWHDRASGSPCPAAAVKPGNCCWNKPMACFLPPWWVSGTDPSHRCVLFCPSLSALTFVDVHSFIYACLHAAPWDLWDLQSMGSQSRTRLSDFTFTFMHWRRKWQPTLVFLPGESQGRGSLVGCHLQGRTELDTTEAT